MSVEGVDRTNLLLEIIATELYVTRADREFAADRLSIWHQADRDLTVDNIERMHQKLSAAVDPEQEPLETKAA